MIHILNLSTRTHTHTIWSTFCSISWQSVRCRTFILCRCDDIQLCKRYVATKALALDLCSALMPGGHRCVTLDPMRHRLYGPNSICACIVPTMNYNLGSFSRHIDYCYCYGVVAAPSQAWEIFCNKLKIYCLNPNSVHLLAAATAYQLYKARFRPKLSARPESLQYAVSDNVSDSKAG